jgi:hypothetical protein
MTAFLDGGHVLLPEGRPTCYGIRQTTQEIQDGRRAGVFVPPGGRPTLQGGMNMKLCSGAPALALLTLAVSGTPVLAGPPDSKNFVAHLSGDDEVPVRETLAQGQAMFRLSGDGSTLSYKLIVANIDNVVAAHIHLGPFGVNGPVVAFLAGNFAPGGGRVDGVIARGTITSANLLGPLAGQSLAVLLAAMRDGGTYVNVHTNDGVAPTNTGPGDFPGGEIRGQIRTAGPGR